MTKKLPKKMGSLLMPFIVSGLMTLIVAGVSTAFSLGLSAPNLFEMWSGAWMISWIIAFPSLIFILPLAKKVVSLVVEE